MGKIFPMASLLFGLALSGNARKKLAAPPH